MSLLDLTASTKLPLAVLMDIISLTSFSFRAFHFAVIRLCQVSYRSISSVTCFSFLFSIC